MKSIHTSVYNALNNVFLVGNTKSIITVVEEISQFVENVNEKAVEEPYDNYNFLIPIAAVLDLFYEKIMKE